MKRRKTKTKSKPRRSEPRQERDRSPIGDQPDETMRDDGRSDRPHDEDVEEVKIGQPVRLEP
jgi:hypothetical protein